jgi:phage protein D
MWSRRNEFPLLLISANGEPAPQVVNACQKFEYWHRIAKASEVRVTLLNNSRKLLEDPALLPNAVWKIRFGFVDDLSPVLWMQVRNIEPDYGGKLPVVVTLFDASMNLTQSSSGRNWGRVKSSDVAKKIAKIHGLGFKGDDSKDIPARDWIQPSDIDDLKFLRDLAGDIDFEVFVEGTTLFYRNKPYDAAPVKTLTYYDDPSDAAYVKSFKPKVKSLGAIKNSASSTDSKGDAKVAGDASGNGRTSLGNYVVDVQAKSRGLTVRRNVDDHAGITKSAASGANVQQLARTAKQQMLDKVNEASSSHPLSPSLRAGVTYVWAGLDKQLNGKWYAKEAHHVMSDRTSSSDLEYKRNATNAKGAKTTNPNTKGEGGAGSRVPVVVIKGGDVKVVDR